MFRASEHLGPKRWLGPLASAPRPRALSCAGRSSSAGAATLLPTSVERRAARRRGRDRLPCCALRGFLQRDSHTDTCSAQVHGPRPGRVCGRKTSKLSCVSSRESQSRGAKGAAFLVRPSRTHSGLFLQGMGSWAVNLGGSHAVAPDATQHPPNSAGHSTC